MATAETLCCTSAAKSFTHIHCLRDAILAADEQRAAAAARQLARRALRLEITVADHSQDADISLKVHLEDLNSSAGVITLKVRPSMTIYTLKQMMLEMYKFPMTVQQWIIGEILATDKMTLADCGVNASGISVFLYLASVTSSTEKAEGGEPQDEANPPVTHNANADDANGWSCRDCTLINEPTRPACSACGSARPEGYVAPSWHVPSEQELVRLRAEKANDELLLQLNKPKTAGEMMFHSLVKLDDINLVTPKDEFVCLVCMDEIEPTDGVTLKNCLHSFCRECLSQHIQHCEDAVIKCPFDDGDYSCENELQEREIRALVSDARFLEHQRRGITLAENRAADSFHCLTADCIGWVFTTDNEEDNFFLCPVCNQLNCLTCRVQHEGVTCKQYQDDLRAKASNDVQAANSLKHIEDMLATKQAMRCPKCNIIIMKKEGCDGIVCTMCRTELCWVTQGLRWGPKGRGDTSGGCRCGINGQKCHPNCRYCH